MPLGRGRVGRRGVIGRPVARTAAVVGGAAVVAHGVGRRRDRREIAGTTVATDGTIAGTAARTGASSGSSP